MGKIIYILIPILISILINIRMYGNRRVMDNIDIKYLPPGFFIGIVWIILLGLMGYILYLLIKKFNLRDIKNGLYQNFNYNIFLIIFLIIFCVMYPYLTSIFNDRFMKNYNYLILIIVLYIFYEINKVSFNIAKYLIPLILWVGYVFVVTLISEF